MELKLRNITNTSIFVLASVGSAIAGLELLLPEKSAFAQQSIRECVQELINKGGSESNAAIVCSRQQDRNDDYSQDGNWDNRDDDYRQDRNWDNNRGRRLRRQRGQVIELRARSGPTPEGRWRYTAPGIPYDVMTRAGCENVSGNDWRCPTRRIRVQLRNERGRNERGRYIELRARSGPTPEGRWRYTAPDIPSEAMSQAGCENVFGKDWRCPTQRIRVQLPEQRSQLRYIELRATSGPTPEGRWRYTAPGIPYEAMSQAGCENVSGNDWRCPTQRIRVQVTDRY